MPRHSDRSVLIDNLLRIIALGGLTATALLATNAIQLFNKPLKNYFKKLDQQQRQQQLRRAISYLKYYKLITENYEHGLSLTTKAQKRLSNLEFGEIRINSPSKWDHGWRVVFFDIPEKQKASRDAFAAKIRQLGFKVLQRSVFIHPFDCKVEVVLCAQHYSVDKYVSYIETRHIDNEAVLIQRFGSLLK